MADFLKTPPTERCGLTPIVPTKALDLNQGELAEVFKFQHAAGVFEKEFALGFFVGGEAADGRDLLDAGAGGAVADGIGAIAAVKEFVLVAGEEGAGVVFVAEEGLEAGAGGEVAVHVWIIGEEAIGDTAGRDRAFRVENFLVVVLRNVAPKRLRVADEIHRGEFLEDAVEAFDVVVVRALLEMHEHGNVELSGEGGDALGGSGVAGDVEFLFTDADGAGFELAADDLDGVRLIGDLVREPAETIGIFSAKA